LCFQPNINDIVPCPAKKSSLNVQPPAPKLLQPLIKYLDLDHHSIESNHLKTPPTTPSGRNLEAHSNGVGMSRSATDYNEIDWCRTKALIETRNEVEHKRRVSDRTLDG